MWRQFLDHSNVRSHNEWCTCVGLYETARLVVGHENE